MVTRCQSQAPRSISLEANTVLPMVALTAGPRPVALGSLTTGCPRTRPGKRNGLLPSNATELMELLIDPLTLPMHMSAVTTLCQVLIDPNLKWGLNKYHSNSIRNITNDTTYPSIYWLKNNKIKQVNVSIIDIIETVLSTYCSSIAICTV